MVIMLLVLRGEQVDDAPVVHGTEAGGHLAPPTQHDGGTAARTGPTCTPP